jgi:hypothetical protein
MYACINKWLLSYSKLFQHSILALQGKKLKNVLSFQKFLQATEHCVGGNMLPATNRLSGPAPHYSRARQDGKRH